MIFTSLAQRTNTALVLAILPSDRWIWRQQQKILEVDKPINFGIFTMDIYIVTCILLFAFSIVFTTTTRRESQQSISKEILKYPITKHSIILKKDLKNHLNNIPFCWIWQKDINVNHRKIYPASHACLSPDYPFSRPHTQQAELTLSLPFNFKTPYFKKRKWKEKMAFQVISLKMLIRISFLSLSESVMWKIERSRGSFALISVMFFEIWGR